MNINDIAKAVGISSATVSRAINNSGYVKNETREKILLYIKENNYVPSAVARSLSIQDTSSIGVIIPDIENSFFSGVISGIGEVAEKNDYNILLFNTNENRENEHRFLRIVQGQRLKGVIITPISEVDVVTRQYLDQLKESGIPVVLVDRDLENHQFDGVFVENIQGAYDGVSEFIAAGHTKISIIAGPETSKPGRDRLKGYKKALEANNIALIDDYIVYGDFKIELGYILTERLLSLPTPPTAIFTTNNLTTLGCLKYLTEHKYKLGQSISVIGFDDIDTLNYVDFRLSIVNRAVSEMGVVAMEILLDRLSNSKDNNIAKRVVLPTNVVLRGSEKLKIN